MLSSPHALALPGSRAYFRVAAAAERGGAAAAAARMQPVVRAGLHLLASLSAQHLATSMAEGALSHWRAVGCLVAEAISQQGMLAASYNHGVSAHAESGSSPLSDASREQADWHTNHGMLGVAEDSAQHVAFQWHSLAAHT